MFYLSTTQGYVWPIDVGQNLAPITSPFGPRRHPADPDPENGHPYPFYDFHHGVDIRTQSSTNAVAVFDGYIIWSDINGDYGYMTFLGDQDGIEDCIDLVGYAHLSNTLNFHEHDEVYEGNQIAVTGGNPAHLHFNSYLPEIDPNNIPDHPVDSDVDHTMFLLPYTNGTQPETSSEIWNGTDESHVTSVEFDVKVDDEELDFNFIQLEFQWQNEEECYATLTDIGSMYNIPLEDGQGAGDAGITKSYSFPAHGNDWPSWGDITIIVKVQDFNHGTDQVLHIKYDFTELDYGSYTGSIPLGAISIAFGDCFVGTQTDPWVTINSFSASLNHK